MTLKDLEQIIHIRNEIMVLTKRLNKAKGGNLVTDCVNDYSTGYPRPIALQGFDRADQKKSGGHI